MTSQGYTIQLFMADGRPDGLIIATQFGWTGQITVARQTTFDSLLGRGDLARPGVYILSGPDPETPTRSRAYIGEADSIRARIAQSADAQGDWWEIAAAITASDNALNKGHVRYLEARLIELTGLADRVILANAQQPAADRRYLPEAERANMERFIDIIRAVLPVVGLDLLKPQPKAVDVTRLAASPAADEDGAQHRQVTFTLSHKSGLIATAVEDEDEFVVKAGSSALAKPNYTWNSYQTLRDSLIADGVLAARDDGPLLTFQRDHAFKSPSAASSVIIGRNSNGRSDWRVTGSTETYGEWQARHAAQQTPPEETP